MIKLIVFVVIAGLLAACGGDSGTDSDPPTTVATLQASTTSQQSTGSTTVATTASQAVVSSTAVPFPTPTSDLPAENRIVITSIGVDAPLREQVVRSDGNMGGTDDPNLVEIYDFSAFPELGGMPGKGNTVVAGNQQQGPGSFIRLGEILEGNSISLAFEGETFEYTVVVLCEASIQDFSAILASTEPEVLTLLQAGGSGSQTRLYAVAERIRDSIPRTCPAGS